MEWFYASGTDQKGPIEQAEFDRLVQGGVVTASTLVWREGMTDWKPYAEVSATSASTSSIGLSKGEVVCSECGRLFGRDETVRLGSGFVCASCKPVAMQKLREGAVDSTSEMIRQEHIKHEASVKSIGILYFLSATGLALMSVSVFTISWGASPNSGSVAFGGVGMGVFCLLFAVALIWVGVGLRGLKSWARIPAGILAGVGLFAIGLGTIINAYILYLLFCRKGKTVFSDEYKQVIAETPHIKYRTSIVIWVLLGLLLFLFGLAMVGVLVGRRH